MSQSQQYIAIIFFGLFGIIGTYSGLSFDTETRYIDRWAVRLEPEEAIANFRVIGAVLGGLLGGYRVGIGAGLIAGIHRFTLGGFTAFSCGFATIIAGFISGVFFRKSKHIKLTTAFLVASMAETLQMAIILLLSRPFEQALTLVAHIGVPMVVANGLGCALFFTYY